MTHPLPAANELDFLSGGGEMGERIRNYPWKDSPLGAPENWDQSLKTCVRIMLTSQQPIWIGWGKELIKLYNDPYKAIAGGKHPAALGQPASVVWKDIWKDISPLLARVMERNEGIYAESQLLIMERYGYPEETYYTFSYSPVPGADGRTAGMLCYNTAETARIINERSLNTLRKLGADIRRENTDAVLRSTVAVLADNNRDFPFSIICRISEEGSMACPVAFAGIDARHPEMPDKIDLTQPSEKCRSLQKAVTENETVLFEDFGDPHTLPTGPWKLAPKEFVHVPISAGNRKTPFAVLTLALNPFRKFDDTYRHFIRLICDQVSLELNNAMAYEEERRRAEALAAIDKAKTVFFSNISHEFRTPLTLILGPLEELLRKPQSQLGPWEKQHIETTHRNALRLLKLVNSLLDFSKIEAGKQKTVFKPTDIAALTRNLASYFRSVTEKAGLQLEIQEEDFPGPVYVDPDMWEKIVFNLLSNAFKYTLKGKIVVSIQPDGGFAVLKVADTGVGIPASELPHMFDRFHRVENTGGRSYEGTGIGLSFVKELVQLQNGEIGVESELEQGTVFTVKIPLTKKAVADDTSIVTEASAAYVKDKIYLSEAELPDDLNNNTQHAASAPVSEKNRALVMVVDDNADMREHIVSVLSGRFDTLTANNGMDALLKLKDNSPDLIISDIMMPVLDGIGLLQEVKKNKLSEHIPVVLLTARAGEESKIEGWEMGADDYLVKPFSARELLARVSSHINLGRMRSANEQSVRNLFSQVPMGIAVYRGQDLEIEMVNDTMLRYWNKTREQSLGKPLWELLPEFRDIFGGIAEEVYRTGKRFSSEEFPVTRYCDGRETTRYIAFGFEPRFDELGNVMGIIGIASNITAQVVNRKKTEESERQLNELANAMPQLVWITDAAGAPLYLNERASAFANAEKLADGSWRWDPVIHPDDKAETFAVWGRSLASGQPYQREHRMQLKDGSYHWFLSRGYAQKDAQGTVTKWFGTATDINEQKSFARALEAKVYERAEQLNQANEILETKNAELERQNEELASFSYVASHDLQEPLRKIQTFSNRIQDLEKDKLSDTGKDYFNRMIAAAKRMHLLIEALLDYSRTNTSDRTLVETDIASLLRDARSNLSILIEEKKAVVEAGPLPKIKVIPHQFQQLLSNIIANSLKYSKPDVAPHIAITAEKVTGADSAHAGLSRNNRYWRFCFQDNGIGFEQQYAGKIFELFQRLHGRMEYSGTGIGLAICKKIVQNHNGVITASGEPGEGARFDVYLPVNE
ncbi:ATP-binding protein [Sediminibacterium soli]|uniref:ATP-binding protein n=1 Tax=Sediminibacterium soli TaxID=2698829 RepID=UPI00137B2A07|nr:ATP-binding protein [Sediminibacterium soli]NCI45656.1 response regulator [Sediminibacterium soli]